MNKQQRHNDAGFSLIEVLVALMILSIGILGISLMQLRAIWGNSTANHLSEATVFGSDQIEQILSWDYNDARLNSSNNSEQYNGKQWDGHDTDNNYDVYWEITDNTPITGSKTIDVTVYWNQKGVLKNFSLSAVKGQ